VCASQPQQWSVVVLAGRPRHWFRTFTLNKRPLHKTPAPRLLRIPYNFSAIHSQRIPRRYGIAILILFPVHSCCYLAEAATTMARTMTSCFFDWGPFSDQYPTSICHVRVAQERLHQNRANLLFSFSQYRGVIRSIFERARPYLRVMYAISQVVSLILPLS
jgi:hypothetical protein